MRARIFTFLPGIILILAALPSYAGYYASFVSASTNNASYPPAASYMPTGCYLLPSMAVQAFSANAPNSSGKQVNTLSLTNASYLSVAYTHTWIVNVAIGTCSAPPSTTTLPAFIGGASDPVIDSGNYSQPGASSTLIEPLNPAMAIEDSLSLWGMGVLFLATIWGLKRIVTLFTRDTA